MFCIQCEQTQRHNGAAGARAWHGLAPERIIFERYLATSTAAARCDIQSAQRAGIAQSGHRTQKQLAELRATSSNRMRSGDVFEKHRE